jgi:DMSO/TMAO reductase YedYZ heme-binding membrane subunit
MPTKNIALLNNSRFYILCFSLLLSIAVVSTLRLEITSDQLFLIRTQQIYGLIAVIFWYVALIISPIGYVIGKSRIKHLEFARRAIGVSAAYFVLLHGLVALQGPLGGLEQLQYLPTLFKWSIGAGFIAFIILLVMALTSFDKVVRFMSFRRWKWLHRLVYFGGVLAVLHIWTIGTHLAYSWVSYSAFLSLAVLSFLEIFRVMKIFSVRSQELQRKDFFAVMLLSLWGLSLVAIASIPLLVENFHAKHSSQTHNHSDKVTD